MTSIQGQSSQPSSETPQSPVHPLEHQRMLTQFLRRVGQLQAVDQADSPHYADAVHQALMDCCLGPDAIGTEQTCECHQQNFTERFNHNLQRHLQRLQTAPDTIEIRQPQSSPSETAATESRNCHASAPAPNPEQIKEWVATDPTGTLKGTRLEGHACINCQTLISRQLFADTSWQALSTEWGVPLATLGRFYQRQCLCHLRTVQTLNSHCSHASTSMV